MILIFIFIPNILLLESNRLNVIELDNHLIIIKFVKNKGFPELELSTSDEWKNEILLVKLI